MDADDIDTLLSARVRPRDTSDFNAASLLRLMLDLGKLKYHPDPIAAIEAAKGLRPDGWVGTFHRIRLVESGTMVAFLATSASTTAFAPIVA